MSAPAKPPGIERKRRPIRLVYRPQPGLELAQCARKSLEVRCVSRGSDVEVLSDDGHAEEDRRLGADDDIDDVVSLEHAQQLPEIRLSHASALRLPNLSEPACRALAVREALGG